MSRKVEFPFEQEARRGQPAPDGLSLIDRMAYTALRGIYGQFYDKKISQEQAGAEKQQLWQKWTQAKETEAFERKLQDYHVRLILGVERAVCRCRKEPTAENALYLCNVLDGIERPKMDGGDPNAK